MKNNISNRIKTWKFLFLFLFLFAVQACNKADTPPEGTGIFSFSDDVILNSYKLKAEAIFDSLRSELFSRINE